MRFDADLRFEQSRAVAVRALARLHQSVFAEDEPAGAAARRLDDHQMTGGARRSNHVTQIVFDVSLAETELARERRHRAWLQRQAAKQIFSKSHPVYRIRR